MNKKELCLVHTDLDGAISYALICWFKERKIPVKALSQADLIVFWKANILPNIKLFDRVYIFDLNVSKEFSIFDHPNVTIVDHHSESIDSACNFTKAKAFCQKSTSTGMLLYKHLKTYKSNFLSDQQKLFLLMADDYDSYQFKVKFSKELNYLFWSYQGDRISKIYEEFKNGFTGFNQQQKNLIYFYKKRLKETIDSLTIYTGNYKIGQTTYTLGSTFADFAINDVADYVIKETNSDICAVVNLKTNRISFRKSKNCAVKLNLLASILSNGGGHEDSAGGILTDTFINLSKSLKLYELSQYSQGGNGSPF